MIHGTPIRADRLTDAQWKRWAELQESIPEFDNPYFRPEFTQAVAAVRDDVEVTVLEESGQEVGYLPFQRGRFGVGRPVSGPLSDFQAVIIEPGRVFNARRLIRQSRLLSWKFDHLLATQSAFASHHRYVEPSPVMNVEGGLKAYLKRRINGSSSTRGVRRLNAKIERLIGPIRFVPHTTDLEVFNTLLRWKRAQYQATGMTDVFSFGWTRKLLQSLLDHSTPKFSGMLSALYGGDRLLAVHFGMRSGGVLHSWFPAYDAEFSNVSAGNALLMQLIQAAPELGLERIDLGKGMQTDKWRYMTGASDVAEGAVECRPLVGPASNVWLATRDWVKQSPLRAPASVPARWVRHLRERALFQ